MLNQLFACKIRIIARHLSSISSTKCRYRRNCVGAGSFSFKITLTGSGMRPYCKIKFRKSIFLYSIIYTKKNNIVFGGVRNSTDFGVLLFRTHCETSCILIKLYDFSNYNVISKAYAQNFRRYWASP